MIKREILRAQTVVAALVAAWIAIAAPTPAPAQDGEWVNPDVIALRDEVERLSREVARLRGGAAALSAAPEGGDAAPAAAGGLSDLYVRLDRLEVALRRINGEIERLGYDAARAAQDRDAILSELTFRVEQLEEATGVAPPPSRTPAPVGPGAVAGAGAGAAAGGERPGAGAPIASGPGAPASALGEIVVRTPGESTPGAGPVLDNPAGGGAGPAPVGGGRGDYNAALESLRNKDYELAESQFNAFIAANPTDARVGEATYWLGETYYVRGRFGDAAKQYLTSFQDHPKGPRAPDSLLKLGMSLAQLGQRDGACKTFSQVRARYPDASASVLRRADVEARRSGCA